MEKRVGMSKNQKAQHQPRAGSETPNVAEVPVNHYHGEPAILHPMTGYGQLNRQNISSLKFITFLYPGLTGGGR